MHSKMAAKPFRMNTRGDWLSVRVAIMRWVLRVKLKQHHREFGLVLIETGDLPIVEESSKDQFWGARRSPDGVLVGANVLGRLLMELRGELDKGRGFEEISSCPPEQLGLRFLGNPWSYP